MSRHIKILIFLVLSAHLLFGVGRSEIDSLKSILASKHVENPSKIHNQLSGFFIDSSLQMAKIHAEEALKLAKTTIDRANAYYTSGELYYYLNELEESNNNYKKALQLYFELNDYSSIANCLDNIGINHEIWGDLETALNHYKSSYRYYKRNNDKRGMAISLNNIGVIYNTWGQYEKGYEYYHESLKIEEELGNKEGIATSLSNIGLIHKKMGQYDRTIEFYKKSIAINEEIENFRHIALTTSNLGSVYSEMGMLDSAEYYYNRALTLYHGYNDYEGMGLANHNIGSIYSIRGEYKKALKHYLKALDLRKRAEYTRGTAVSMANIANTYLKLNKPDSAKVYLEQSYAIANKLKLSEELAENYKTYSDLYYAISDYKQSLAYYKKFKAMRDSLLNENNHKQITEMQTKYETEKKEQKIKLQQADIETKEAVIQKERVQKYALFAIGGLLIIMAIFIYSRYRYKNKINKVLKEKNDQLVELNATKNKFFSIISHDLKNPFGTLVSVSDMLKKHYNELDEDEKQHIITTISKSAGMTQNLLENLLQWSMTQTGRIQYQPSAISIKDILGKVVKLLQPQASKKNLLFKIDAQDEHFAYADKNAVETVIRNLCSNAVKFSDKEGYIHITIQKVDHSVIVHIKDNGVGLKKEDADKLFRIDVDHRKIGKSREKGTGLGLVLCKEFIEINKGEIWVESELGHGSIFSFSLPLFKSIR